MMLRPKPNIEKLAPASHGGIDYLELEQVGILPEDVLDFSVSTNPFGPPPGIKEALSRASVDCYPDSESTELRLLLAEKLRVDPNNLLIGSGSTELIRLVATAYFSSDDLLVIPQPTYSEYEIACCLVAARVLRQLMSEETGFRLNVAEAIDLIQKHHPKGVFLCNPNNPTGQYLLREEVKQILSVARDTLVILDEAYIAFAENAWISTELMDCNHLVILRSMTKDYALAGLRLGYAIAPESIISVLKRVKPPWNVSSVAQMAGVFALKADGYFDMCLTKTREAKKFLVEGLRGLGLSPLPSQTNFFLVKVGDAARFRKELLKKGILVRDCTSFGMPDYVRLSPRDMAECQKLLTAISDTGVYRYAS
ncbi:MAG: histidinol-phosphate aminotransferase family protein [Chloroflexi bacterium]|nr:histidinol-phosphate aminotransferase family protein [Chloroflexota bacterium]